MITKDRQTVMIVDDSLFVCERIKHILSEEDFLLCEAHTGDEAMDRIGASHPDLILLDVVLPDIEGYVLYDKLKALDQNEAVIIFLTSIDDNENVIKGFMLGASDYIRKPFYSEELKARVRTHLALKKQKDELNRLNSELSRNMERLNYMAFRDGLTGLYNRRYVEENLKEELKNYDGRRMENVFVLCDIDDFKAINDTYGHDAGDMTLITVTETMKDVCHRHRIVRWGGEEFLVILFGVTKEEAFFLCEEMRRQIKERPTTQREHTFFCTITMGFTVYDRELGIEENINQADQALYYGKRNGKNCCVWYNEIGEER